MKKFFKPVSIILAIALCASLTGCGGSSNLFYYARVGAETILGGDVVDKIQDSLYELNDQIYSTFYGDDDADKKDVKADSKASEDEKSDLDTKESSVKDESKSLDDEKSDSKNKEDKSKDKDDTSKETASKDDDSDSKTNPSEPKIKNDYLIDYYHYDYETFTDLCDEFVEAGKENDADDIESLYDSLIDEIFTVLELHEVCYLYYSADVNDDYFSTENVYTEKLLNDVLDSFYIACSEVYKSDGSDAFVEIADESIIDECKDYEPQTEEEKKLIEKETELENEYNTALSNLDDYKYEYNGKEYSYDDLSSVSSALSLKSLFDYEDFLKIYEGVLKTINENLGPIYIELVEIRVQLAKCYGYDNYSDYCYEEQYKRAYTTEDTQAFCDTVKSIIKDDSELIDKITAGLYYSDLVTTEVTYEDLLKDLESALKGYGELYLGAYDEFTTKELYNFGDDSCRLDGAYTIYVDKANVPFVFANIEKTASSFITVSHEFGHFTNYVFETSNKSYDVFGGENLDILEIHSNGLQMLLTNEYDDIFDESDSSYMKLGNIANLLYQIVEGCKYDEFQRHIYENPGMTLDEINEYFGELSKEYGGSSSDEQYLWTFIPHNFESPLYYISYAISSLSAMDIYLTSLDDKEKAINKLETVVKQPDNMDYDEVMETANLTKFYDEKAVKQLLGEFAKLMEDEDVQE